MKSWDNLLPGSPSLEMPRYTHKTQDGEQGEFWLHLQGIGIPEASAALQPVLDKSLTEDISNMLSEIAPKVGPICSQKTAVSLQVLVFLRLIAWPHNLTPGLSSSNQREVSCDPFHDYAL